MKKHVEDFIIPFYDHLQPQRMFKSRLPVFSGFSLLIIPILNLFFIYLIFFLLGASHIHALGIMIDPPVIENAQFDYADKLVITMRHVTAKNDDQPSIQIFFNNQIVQDYYKLEKLLRKIVGDPKLRINNPKGSGRLPIILLRADKRVPLNEIAQIMGICRRNYLRLFIVAGTP
ncbi:MAG: hypothetical protein D6820_05985 [Lentisphaerae bacterium]|nr:MAG: hypothetical protein D6820_05985 [Lentisphaerota bacterium]